MSDSTPTELETLKARATQMGISFHPTIGVDKLREKVNAAIDGTPAPSDDSGDDKPEVKVSARQAKQDAINKLRKESAKLVRVNVTCMNPNKKEWKGEIFHTGNSQIGMFKKFVPFNTENGFHVPQIIFNMMNDRKFQTFYTETVGGNKVRKGKLIKEYAIELLPDLTPEELKALAIKQAAAKGQV